MAYPAPVWRSAGTFVSGIGSVTPGLPAGWAQNDIFILAVEAKATDTIATPSGWTAVVSSPQTTTTGSSTSGKLAVFYRRATASESAPVLADSGDHTAAIIHAISGCVKYGSPIDVEAGGENDSASTDVFMAAVTTTVADTLIVYIGGHGVSTTSAQVTLNTNWGNLNAITERSDNSTNSGTGGGIYTYMGDIGAPAFVDSTEFTLATASSRTYITLALKPPPDPGTSTGTAVANAPTAASGGKPVAVTGSTVVGATQITSTAGAGQPSGSTTANAAKPALAARAGAVTASAVANAPSTNTSGNLHVNADQNAAVVTVSGPGTIFVGARAQGIG